jgi:hypothetical protein
VVSQNPACAFDVPVLPLGYWVSFKIVRCRPCLAAALRSLRCFFCRFCSWADLELEVAARLRP